jgi:hypothetical protein
MSNVIKFPQEILTKRTVRLVAKANREALMSSLFCQEELERCVARLNSLSQKVISINKESKKK